MKEQKGITLIALIITIIVMLILLGITTNIALNGGIVPKAKTATIKAEEEAILQEMLSMMKMTDNGIFNPEKIIEKMKKKYNVEYDKPDAIITGKLGTYNYIVSETEIKIGSTYEELGKYILGIEKTGRLLNQIMDMDNNKFIDDQSTENVDETAALNLEFLTKRTNENTTKEFIYAKSNNKAYKITCDKTTIYKEEAKTEKLEKIYEPSGNEGKDLGEIKNDDQYKGWTILYDYGDGTVEAVSPDAIGKLTLGSKNIDEARFSYNNAIKIINEYCENLEGLPTNTGVRSVGAKAETTDESETLKEGDTNYEQDLVRMSYWDVDNSNTRYWMASRVVRDATYFNVRNLSNGKFSDIGFLVYLYYNQSAGQRMEMAVRPIITVNIN